MDVDTGSTGVCVADGGTNDGVAVGRMVRGVEVKVGDGEGDGNGVYVGIGVGVALATVTCTG